MVNPPFNPSLYCPSCGTSWGIVDETCGNCGFDPVSNEDDAAFYEEALDLYTQMQNLRGGD
jgi:hypothetical protein